jgi:predicted enzyme related to lactoylglutathione lyase
MGNPVVWFEVMGKDGPKLRSFYGDLFGWSYEEVEGMDYGMVQEADGGEMPSIQGGIGTAPEGAPNYQTFYVAVDDVQAALDKAESLGGTTTVPPMDLPMGGKIAIFNDPEGNMIGLFKGPAEQPG